MELDRIDIELLRLLRNNARMPNKDLAEKVGVAPSTALERIRRMREAKIIEGYHAELSPTGIGIGLQAMVAVRLSRHCASRSSPCTTTCSPCPRSLPSITSPAPTISWCTSACANTDHLRDFALSALTSRPEVAHIETNLIFEYRRSAELPIYLDAKP